MYDYINRVDKRFRLAIFKGMKIHYPLSLLCITMILRVPRKILKLLRSPTSVMAMKWFRWNAVGPPEWECEAMGSVVWVQCATSAECINLSIAESTVTDRLESRVHHGSTHNKFVGL